jgi:hypothetical protein
MASRHDTPPDIFEWKAGSVEEYFNLYFNGQRIGWLAKRPAYCDRGRWQFNSELPLLDAADGFPRYYMNFERAKAEAEEWSKWKMQSL